MKFKGKLALAVTAAALLFFDGMVVLGLLLHGIPNEVTYVDGHFRSRVPFAVLDGVIFAALSIGHAVVVWGCFRLRKRHRKRVV